MTLALWWLGPDQQPSGFTVKTWTKQTFYCIDLSQNLRQRCHSEAQLAHVWFVGERSDSPVPSRDQELGSLQNVDQSSDLRISRSLHVLETLSVHIIPNLCTAKGSPVRNTHSKVHSWVDYTLLWSIIYLKQTTFMARFFLRPLHLLSLNNTHTFTSPALEAVMSLFPKVSILMVVISSKPWHSLNLRTLPPVVMSHTLTSPPSQTLITWARSTCRAPKFSAMSNFIGLLVQQN